MRTIDKIFKTEYEAKKSIFLAFLAPFDRFESLRNELKQNHPKANHIVWAYRVLNEFEQVVENQSDDGEPKGTSGPPCLNALRGAGLINCAVLVVRYFGGIKLGTGGLVRAYGASTNAVIDTSELKIFEITNSLKFSVPYDLLRQFEYHIQTNNLPINNKNFEANGVIIDLQLSKKQTEEFLIFCKRYEYVGFSLI